MPAPYRPGHDDCAERNAPPRGEPALPELQDGYVVENLALFGVGEEELLEYRFSHAPLHPFRVPAALPAHLVHVGEALGVLRELHHERTMRPVADTVTRLLAITRAHVGLVLRSAGEQALANVLHLAELARQYEADGGISFRGFVEELREAAGREQAPEAPILEEGSDGVRLMTVHKAKGLEFPVVILADITAKLRREEAGRYLDVDAGRCAVRIAGLTPKDLIDHEVEERNREEAEGVRLAYVAATRARDLLVIPAIGDGPYEGGWISPTNVAVYPAPRARRDAAEPAGCPTFGKDTVLERPDGDPARADTMCPGRHTMGDGAAAYDVVWWDPSVLDLSATPHYGLKREDLIAKEVAPAVVEGKLRAYRDWQQGRDSALEQGSRASLDIRTAGEWARSGDPLPGGLLVPDVTIVTLARAATYPTGRRFGTLLHVVLAAVPLGGDLARVDDLAAVHGHLLGAPAEEIAAAAALTRTVLAHPVMLEAAAAERSGACRREVPVTYRCPDGSLVEGVVDLAFGRGDAWVVVDFKTDRVVDTALDTYRRQVGLYAAAVSRATGASCDGILVVA